METAPHKITFDRGTIVLHAPHETTLPLPPRYVWDDRINAWRGEAIEYAPLIMALHRAGIPYDDQARQYRALQLHSESPFPPRDYQKAAVTAWHQASRQGVIVLPTGTGKSFVARLAMEDAQRSTLVVVPTIDLMEQWISQLNQAFGVRIGMVGGGSHEFCDITVITYDSALLMMEGHGNQFGLLIVDECHHLPSAAYRQLARFCLAPYRLGLTATPERQDDDANGDTLENLLGAICFRKDIDELEGTALAPYHTERIPVDMDEDEYSAYMTSRQKYTEFIHQNRIDMGAADGWKKFLIACARGVAGREALNAYFMQRKLSRTCRAKLQKIWELLLQHRQERVLIFTADNETAYMIGERFFLPVLTHHTKLAERRYFLEAFRNGELPYLVTSKVLNEGVDVPEASVGIVVSGTGSIREHVQRLGRILRPAAGKQAVLYELISMGTSEWSVSDRRRQHRAYERSDNMPG